MQNRPLILPDASAARILVGDVGATRSRFAIYRAPAGRSELLRQASYASSEHSCLTSILEDFLHEEQDGVQAACLGLPAPIHAGVVFPLTNLPWKVDRDEISRTIGTHHLALINDVEAAAAGIADLAPDDLLCLRSGHPDPSGNRAVISVGTGLGVSAVTPSGHVFATEAGHASFSPDRDPDFELQTALQRKYGHVSWERVASGLGLPQIHAILAGTAEPRLPGPEIFRRAETDPVCERAVAVFRRYIGNVAGNIALSLMATGGIYLRGGVATNVLGVDSSATFLQAFLEKGRMRPLLERVPVYVINESDLALWGAARTAIAMLEPGDTAQ